MSLKLHNLKKPSAKRKKRVGRGGKRGTYAGRGMKGQRSRSGGKAGLKRLGLRELMQQTHKLKGFKSNRPKAAIVSLSDLQRVFKEGETVTPQKLFNKGVIKTAKHGVKILNKGSLTRKLVVKNCGMSKSVSDLLNNELTQMKDK